VRALRGYVRGYADAITSFAFSEGPTRTTLPELVRGAVGPSYGSMRSAHRAIRRAFSQPLTVAGGSLYVNGVHVTKGNSLLESNELNHLSRVSSFKTQT